MTTFQSVGLPPSACIAEVEPALKETITPIIPIQHLDQIKKSIVKNTGYFLDLDDTAIDSLYMLGSKAWRKYISEATKNDKTRKWHDIISLYVARNYPIGPVEESTSSFIHNLQADGHMVFGLTARERNMWYYTPCDGVDLLTQSQLAKTDIDFMKTHISEEFSYITDHPACFANIFFVDTDTKGEFVFNHLNGRKIVPPKVVVVDDNLDQLATVKKALEQLQIEHDCYFYGQIDEKSKKFDPLIANIQLYSLLNENKILSDDDAFLFENAHAGKDAVYYLTEILHLISEKMP
jgi:hypothetical protein